MEPLRVQRIIAFNPFHPLTRKHPLDQSMTPTPERVSAPNDFAGEIQVSGGPPPSWLRWIPYVFGVWGLGYIVAARAFDPVNLAFGGLLLAWMIYTPLAQKRGWFHIAM